MYHQFLSDRELVEFLVRIDEEAAARARTEGCPCGGVLHRADYPRKPRGEPAGTTAMCGVRLSLCCSKEGCRKRRTPASVRFLGRRVYLGLVVVVAAAVEGGVTLRRVRLLGEMLGQAVDRRTVERWVKWWRETLTQSLSWKGLRGRLRSEVDGSRMPLSLLEAFVETGARERLVGVLRLLAPLGSRHGL